MGVWSTSINGNDLAMDMQSEYSVAFSRHEPEEAVAILDAHIKKGMPHLDENDGDWVDYRYSLAWYMWKKGVLYDAIRDEVISMVDRGVGLDLYDDAQTLRQRKKVLEAFRAKMLSPQPPRKPIKLSKVQTKRLFDTGDVIAMQLKTSNVNLKTYPHRKKCPFTQEEFSAMDGMWLAWRKVGDDISWRSSVDPEICDIWPLFQMYVGLFPTCPTIEEVQKVPFYYFCGDPAADSFAYTLLTSDNSMGRYRKQNSQVIGQDLRRINEAVEAVEKSHFNHQRMILIGTNTAYYNSNIELASILWKK